MHEQLWKLFAQTLFLVVGGFFPWHEVVSGNRAQPQRASETNQTFREAQSRSVHCHRRLSAQSNRINRGHACMFSRCETMLDNVLQKAVCKRWFTHIILGDFLVTSFVLVTFGPTILPFCNYVFHLYPFPSPFSSAGTINNASQYCARLKSRSWFSKLPMRNFKQLKKAHFATFSYHFSWHFTYYFWFWI